MSTDKKATARSEIAITIRMCTPVKQVQLVVSHVFEQRYTSKPFDSAGSRQTVDEHATAHPNAWKNKSKWEYARMIPRAQVVVRKKHKA